MSHYMTALAMRQTGLKPATKIVLYWLADHHNGESGQCNPSINRLAKACEMSRRSVENHLQSLQDLGLIQIRNDHRDKGGKTSNIYTLCMTESDAQNLRMGSAKSAHGDTQNLRMKNLGISNLGNELRNIHQIDENGFNEFWERYPRKVGKGAAKKAYAKAMKVARHDDLMFALSQQLPAMQSQEQQFRPHASTWLNSERWNDEPEKPTDNNRGRSDANTSAQQIAFAATARRTPTGDCF